MNKLYARTIAHCDLRFYMVYNIKIIELTYHRLLNLVVDGHCACIAVNTHKKKNIYKTEEKNRKTLYATVLDSLSDDVK